MLKQLWRTNAPLTFTGLLMLPALAARGWCVKLAPAVQIPELPERRGPALEQLVAQRALGRHIAALLEVPFEEGVA